VAMSPPRIIGGREPVRLAIQPLAMFDTMKVPVSGRKASPAWTYFTVLNSRSAIIWKRTTLMDSRASNGDIFHGPTAANLFNRR
jgi:hypothetical protein